MEPIIVTKNLIKAYQSNGASFEALRGVNMRVASGEFVAVMGPSGCGKSTLLHMLGGLDSPTKGEVYIAGQRIDNVNETRRAILRRRQIGFVFQFFNLIGNLTVADNVELPALMAGMRPAEARQKREQLLGELGIADKARAVPSQTSGGQRQRVALARALINTPTILLADEPTGNLDSASTQEVLALLRQYHQQGQTILMVTHDSKVASIADRVIQMRDGQIRQETTLENREGAPEALHDLIELGV